LFPLQLLAAGAVNARFSQRIQQPNSRFPLRPATPDALPASAPYLRLPAHRALAARLAAAAAKASAGGQVASRQQQQLQQRRGLRHLPRNGNVWSVDLQADVQAVCKEVGLPREVAAALAAAAAAGQVSANPGVLLSQVCDMVLLMWRILITNTMCMGHVCGLHTTASRASCADRACL
jgi:hypothetical protein